VSLFICKGYKAKLNLFILDFLTLLFLFAFTLSYRHNFGLEHAGEGGDEYKDYSGYMSGAYVNVHSQPYSPRQCYNAVGHARFGWFSDKTRYISDPWSNGGLLKVAAFVDYPIAVAGVDDIIVQIGSYIFMQYNRARDHNVDTYEYPDSLVVVQDLEGRDGSFIQTVLTAGQVYDASNTGRIEVCARVDGQWGVSPDYLLVSITGYGSNLSLCSQAVPVSTQSVSSEGQVQSSGFQSSGTSGITPFSSAGMGGSSSGAMSSQSGFFANVNGT
jgi:hypothetical protein